MLRNPLASPDMIGMSAGASAAAVLASWCSASPGRPPPRGGRPGGRGGIHVLARRRRRAAHRLILMGIGVAAMLAAVMSYLLAGPT